MKEPWAHPKQNTTRPTETDTHIQKDLFFNAPEKRILFILQSTIDFELIFDRITLLLNTYASTKQEWLI